jgi:7,8-dihydropterin-6-yl-methyl-4-(beta-D-ribofuranosyl)aminobenzene 5'-phosphate synthase
MRIRLSTLAENSASWLGLLAEWGLSILVETDDVKILVDTGLSMVAAHNARIMGVKIKSGDKILFSHGHEDHTGGLIDLLKLDDISKCPWSHRSSGVWAPKFWRSGNGNRYRNVGIPFAVKLAESLGASYP